MTRIGAIAKGEDVGLGQLSSETALQACMGKDLLMRNMYNGCSRAQPCKAQAAECFNAGKCEDVPQGRWDLFVGQGKRNPIIGKGPRRIPRHRNHNCDSWVMGHWHDSEWC